MYIVSGPLMTAKQGFLCGFAIKLTRRAIDRLDANANAKQGLPDGLGATTTRTAMDLGELAQHPCGSALMCSPLSKIQVTAAKRRSTVHRHKSRKRRAYLGERAGTPLEHVSQWRQSSANPGRRSDWSASVKRTKLRPQNTKTLRTAHRRRRQKRTHGTGSMRSKPYGRSSSHLLSSPTLNRPSNPLPTIVHVETPLSPSPECPALWTYPETFDKHTTPPLDRLGCLERMSARFRPSSSEISDIMPCTG